MTWELWDLFVWKEIHKQFPNSWNIAGNDISEMNRQESMKWNIFWRDAMKCFRKKLKNRKQKMKWYF